MNTYCKSTLNQIKFALDTVIKILDNLDEKDLQKRHTLQKHSIGELLEHIATICNADMLISSGATIDEMNNFYSSISYKNMSEIKEAIHNNFRLLEGKYMNYSDEQLQQKMTSYWGIRYTRYEWLVEILAHVYHHRGQLHAILVHCYEKDPKISMFQ